MTRKEYVKSLKEEKNIKRIFVHMLQHQVKAEDLNVRKNKIIMNGKPVATYFIDEDTAEVVFEPIEKPQNEK